MKLFPYTLVRVGGAPFFCLRRLNASLSADIARQIAVCQQKQQALKPDISQTLYTVIGQTNSPTLRRQLIQIRRDLFNDRPQAIEMIPELIAQLPQEVNQLLTDYKDVSSKLSRLQQIGKHQFFKEVKAVRFQLKNMVQSDPFQKGLLLSSQSLLKYGLPRYLASETARLSKQALKTERSLLQYLTRMAAKTTPYSTFTNLALITHCDNQLVSSDVQSHIRLNNNLYQHLAALLLKYEPIYQHIMIRPNPTLSITQGQYVFLVNSYNVESFQRLPIQPILEWIVSLVTEHREGISYQNLVQTILDSGQLDASKPELTSYVNQLIAYGFLEFYTGVSGIDPDWDISLSSRLEKLPADIPYLQDLLEVLKKVRNLTVRYSMSTLEDRQKYLQDAYDQVKKFCHQLHEAADLPAAERQSQQERQKTSPPKNNEKIQIDDETKGGFERLSVTYFYLRPENLFYEDTTREWRSPISRTHLAEVTNRLHNLFMELRPLVWLLSEQEKMLHYYCHRFGSKTPVKLLTFYEEYYRDVKKPEADKQDLEAKHDANPFMAMLTAQAEQKDAKFNAWKSNFSQTLSQSGALVQLVSGQITDAVQAGSLSVPDTAYRPNSYGAFVQLYSSESSLQAVINSPLPGFGKFMSRFLHLFDEEVITEVRRWNEAIAQDSIFAEIADASYFNANLHPPLLAKELRLPNGHNNLPANCQIPVTECHVELTTDQQALQLVHTPTGKRVYPFDLGFESLHSRSQLFRLLMEFSYVEWPTFGPVLQVINEQAKAQAADETAVWMRPRVIYEDQLILQRKAWIVPQADLPFSQKNEDEWQYFVRVNQWRFALGIPDEIFISLVDRQEIMNQDTKTDHSLSRDHYKPQYIHFDNPLLVGLFGRLLPKVPTALTIQEMLPGSNQLWEVNQQPHVTEFLLQWQD